MLWISVAHCGGGTSCNFVIISRSHVEVHDVSTVLFWKDSWHSEILETSHPCAFLFASPEDIPVKDFLFMGFWHRVFICLSLSLPGRKLEICS